MALPLLANGGADCGPSNPIQGLTKRFEHDRGAQQDQFVTGRAGPSRQNFRTQHTADPAYQSEATQFFQDVPGPSSSHPLSARPAPLPSISSPSPAQNSQWASAFQSQLASTRGSGQATSSRFAEEFMQHLNVGENYDTTQGPQAVNTMRWQKSSLLLGNAVGSPLPGYRLQSNPLDAEHVTRAIQALELSQQAEEATEASLPISTAEMDALARTAALLVESVKNEENPKFRNSSFVSLMKQLRDREMVVEDNDFKRVSGPTWAAEFGANEDKGKGKARSDQTASTHRRKSVHFEPDANVIEDQNVTNLPLEVETELDRYLRQENEEYSLLNDEFDRATRSSVGATRNQVAGDATQHPEWGHLQADWDSFEATAVGIRPVDMYHFQQNNPYLNREFSTTRHHSFHGNARFEDVLQKEAVVQKDPTNARAWFELGVKQQENEREKEAIQALCRALEHDPTLLDAWLALAVSYTNENEPGEAYDAIERWIVGNERYRRGISPSGRNPDADAISARARCNMLVDTIMTIIRGNPEVDADTQIALAVLLNTTEDYSRASDCFKAALVVRPEDWSLYNRVGATLANSGNPEEATHYYYRALELNPGYIRARFNLGISCINLRRYDEAAQHILNALVLQGEDAAEGPQPLPVTRGVTTSALWDSLKTTYLHLQRSDLASLCDERNLSGIRTALAANYV